MQNQQQPLIINTTTVAPVAFRTPVYQVPQLYIAQPIHVSPTKTITNFKGNQNSSPSYLLNTASSFGSPEKEGDNSMNKLMRREIEILKESIEFRDQEIVKLLNVIQSKEREIDYEKRIHKSVTQEYLEKLPYAEQKIQYLQAENERLNQSNEENLKQLQFAINNNEYCNQEERASSLIDEISKLRLQNQKLININSNLAHEVVVANKIFFSKQLINSNEEEREPPTKLEELEYKVFRSENYANLLKEENNQLQEKNKILLNSKVQAELELEISKKRINFLRQELDQKDRQKTEVYQSPQQIRIQNPGDITIRIEQLQSEKKYNNNQ